MRLAEHFAVGTVGCAAFAPSGYVVGVHFGEFPDFVPVRIFRHGTVWAVGFSRRLGLGCLRRIDTLPFAEAQVLQPEYFAIFGHETSI